MRATVFDKIRRTDESPQTHEESTFRFYNRVSGSFWDAARDVLQEWANNVPDEDYADLRGRLRSDDKFQFNSVYLELYLHEALRRANYTVQVHPATPSGSLRRPDFYASRLDDRFYLEATAPAASRESQARGKRLARLYDFVNKTNDSNWTLWMEEVDDTAATPPAAKLRESIRKWLAILDPADYRGSNYFPRHEFVINGWRIALSAIPRTPEKAALREGRSIGVYPAVAQLGTERSSIRYALSEKTNAYGKLDASFVVAVGTYSFSSDRPAIADALYGDRQDYSIDDDTSIVGRSPRGFFGAPAAWKHTDVSGVLIVNQLMPTHFSTADVSLWPHPAAIAPLPTQTGLPADSVSLVSNNLVTTPSPVSPQMFFGLPTPWPPGEPFSRVSRDSTTSSSRDLG